MFRGLEAPAHRFVVLRIAFAGWQGSGGQAEAGHPALGRLRPSSQVALLDGANFYRAISR